MRTYSVFIAEDEQPAMDLLAGFIRERTELKLKGQGMDGEESYRKLSEEYYDILFLDINMPLISGLEILEKLEEMPYVIFTTAYDKYAVRAFDMNAVDFLLKPFTRERFNKAVDKAVSLISAKKEESAKDEGLGLSFKEGEIHYVVPYDEVIYLSSSARHTVIHTEEKDYETATLLGDIADGLPDDKFIRIHKQCVVNMKYISHIQYLIGGQYAVYLKDEDNSMLTVGRKYAPILKEKMRV